MCVNYGGVGFGLVICKEFVIKLGGDIDVKFCLGEGSMFIFDINFGDVCEQFCVDFELG